jgi:hypothetical protein
MILRQVRLCVAGLARSRISPPLPRSGLVLWRILAVDDAAHEGQLTAVLRHSFAAPIFRFRPLLVAGGEREFDGAFRALVRFWRLIVAWKDGFFRKFLSWVEIESRKMRENYVFFVKNDRFSTKTAWFLRMQSIGCAGGAEVKIPMAYNLIELKQMIVCGHSRFT